MSSVIRLTRSALLGASLATSLAVGALAQAPQFPPPPPPAPAPLPPLAPSEPAAIAACLCLQRSYTALAADMNAKNEAYAAANREVEGLTAQLASERASANANSPDAAARIKALLERHDALTNSLPPAYTAAAQATARYNAQVGEYNARCANQPFNSALVAQIQANLVCPPPR